MRRALLYMISILVVLSLAGCSAASDLSGLAQRVGGTASPTPTASVAPATPAPAPSTSSATSNDPAVAAIQAVIKKADQEQQDAFAKNDPTLMKDTATSAYYQQLVQINSDMASQGVTGIQLVQIEWGPISVTNPTTAQATSFETWRTTLSDGSTDQSRDRNVYALVQTRGNWLIQSDDHPDQQQPGTPPGQTISPNPSVPTPPGSQPVSSRTDVSRNWSGYAATGGTFTAVTGTWTVPRTDVTGNPGSGATWVGIGGTQSRDLIQAGTEETSSGSGHARYDAWIEMLPRSSQQVPLTVGPGDAVTVSITGQAGNQWLISMKNDTTGQTYQTTVTYASSRSSAEWVMEAPSAPRQVLPLDDFGTVQFTGASATENGRAVSIAKAGGHPITMIDARGNALASPSALTSDGSGFSINRTDTPAVSQPGPTGGNLGPSGRARPGRSFHVALH